MWFHSKNSSKRSGNGRAIVHFRILIWILTSGLIPIRTLLVGGFEFRNPENLTQNVNFLVAYSIGKKLRLKNPKTTENKYLTIKHLSRTFYNPIPADEGSKLKLSADCEVQTTGHDLSKKTIYTRVNNYSSEISEKRLFDQNKFFWVRLFYLM